MIHWIQLVLGQTLKVAASALNGSARRRGRVPGGEPDLKTVFMRGSFNRGHDDRVQDNEDQRR
jgi:hypothetical protein